MTSLPKKFSANPKNPNSPLVRDNKGRFSKAGSASDKTISDSQAAGATGISKESQPGLEQFYLEEAEKTKELKEQLKELEKEAEVKEIKGEIELPEIVKKQGVEVIGEETPIPSQPGIVLPMDDTKIYKVVQNFKKLHQSVKDSVTWMGLWCFRQLQMVGIKLKLVGGKIVRQKVKS